jgi:hypothetical protein
LKGSHLASDHEVEEAAHVSLKSSLSEGKQKLVDRWSNWVEMDGEYTEQ